MFILLMVMLLLFSWVNFMLVLFNLSPGLLTVLYLMGIIAESNKPFLEGGCLRDEVI